MHVRNELENPIVIDDMPVAYRTRTRACTCGCKLRIVCNDNNYIVIGDWLFATEECVTDFFIQEHGGRRVYAV